MPREPQEVLFVGIKDSVLAIDASTGAEIWRVTLKSGDYTNVLFDGEWVFAANAGEVFCLDPRTGTLVWQNEMKGLGRGLVSLASSRKATSSSDANAAMHRRQQDAGAASAAAAV